MYSHKSVKLFVDIATQHELKYEIKKNINVEVLFKVNQQSNLKFDIQLCLLNNDELWFYIDDLYFCMFPFKEVKNTFRSVIDSFISGRYRVLKLYQDGFDSPYQWSIQEYNNDKWKNILTTNRFFKNPFLPVRHEILQN